MSTIKMVREGRAWLFADSNINSDLIMPQSAFIKKTIEEQVKLIFSANRPGWVDLVKEGDILIGGKNFGTGSSRPGAMLLKKLGIGGLIAESISGLFYRSCINYALPTMECPGIIYSVNEGDVIHVNFVEGLVQNVTTNKSLQGQKTPEFLLKIMDFGGVMEMLKKEGYI